MALLFTEPRYRPLSAQGEVIPGARLYSYQTETTVLQNTWADDDQTVLNANPIVADGSGLFGPIYLDESLPKYKFVLRDALENTIWTVDPYNPQEEARYPVTAAEQTAGVTPSDKNKPPYYRSRYNSWADWKAAADHAGLEATIDGDYTLTADIELPGKVRCDGGALSGNYTVLYQQRNGGWVDGLYCYNFRLRGCVLCSISNLVTLNNVDIDGFNTSYGVFWNEFINWNVNETLTINITNWSVNENNWRGGRINYMHITGNTSLYAGTQAHSNTFDGVDFTDNGVLQDDTAFEVNYMRGLYYEGGANIVGNFHIFGYQGDALGMPLIARHAHIMGSVGRNPRTSRDFLSLSVRNQVTGGEWDMLDASGKPVGLSHTGGANVAVVGDSSEPCGIGQRYQAEFSGASGRFNITIQPCGSDRFGLVLYYKSTDDFVAIESSDGSGTTSYSNTPVVVDQANSWKMLRISGPANKTATTGVVLYAYGGAGGATKTMSIGGIFGGTERAVRSPQRNGDIQSGTFVATLTGVSSTVTASAYYERTGNKVTLFVPALTGTSNSTSCTITGLPANLSPARTQGDTPALIQDNGTAAMGRVQMATSGVISAYKSASATGSDWTNSGTKTVSAFNLTYLMS